jgi:hypothetical protein
MNAFIGAVLDLASQFADRKVYVRLAAMLPTGPSRGVRAMATPCLCLATPFLTREPGSFWSARAPQTSRSSCSTPDSGSGGGQNLS